MRRSSLTTRLLYIPQKVDFRRSGKPFWLKTVQSDHLLRITAFKAIDCQPFFPAWALTKANKQFTNIYGYRN